MTTESLQLSFVLTALPQDVYLAWLDSQAHSDFTGSAARVDPRVGGRFSAWDGYIEGETLELEPYRRILQAWRTSEFPGNSADSILEIVLESTPDGGTLVNLNHTNIPAGQAEDYKQGWYDNYTLPMQSYFKEKRPSRQGH